MTQFRRERLSWNSEHVARFWDWYSSSGQDGSYFTNQHGNAVVRFARKNGVGVGGGRVLDFGCGPGFLISRLLEAGWSVTGVDYSSQSVERTRARYAGRSGFEGVEHIVSLPTKMAAGSFDAAFLIETMEHLDAEHATSILTELRRLLKPGGKLVVTTPNEERLDDKMVMCPRCGAEFHRVQHVRSFSAESLESVLAEHGFETSAVSTVTLGPDSRLWRIRSRLSQWRKRRRALNLMVVATRRE